MDPRGNVPATDAASLLVVWLSAGSCDGCSMAVLGATSPRLEELLAGGLTRRQIDLVHPLMSLDAGDPYLRRLDDAAAGRAGPYVLVVEGTLFDERLAGGGSFSGVGRRQGRPVTAGDRLEQLAARAQAVVAIGSCASWGGIPAAAGNVTGAHGVGAHLGDGFRSAADLPVVAVPGCAPSGDAFVELLSYVVLHLDGRVPLDLDDLGRPRWLYRDDVTVQRPATGTGPREPEPGLVAQCPVPALGWINRLGGCGAVGGGCNGCTRTDFPDRTLPLLAAGGHLTPGEP